MEKFGIENLKTLTIGVASVATGIGGIVEDKKVNIKDLQHGKDLIVGLVGMSKVKYSELRNEISDLSEDEKIELADIFEREFDLTEDSLEMKIEQGMTYLFKGLDAVKFLLSLKAK